ncbi:hypothetical protein [Actinoallomurus acaciae]|uniref:Uncharacterized protein n=1 Tax=Actinoallomurus acaciae TaxID=502577 RepID=A0ABV5YDU7_9ACTN
MSEAGRPLGLSRTVRRIVWSAVFAGFVVGGLYAVMGLMGQGTRLLSPVVFVVLVLVGRPLAVLGGRTRLSGGDIAARRPPLWRVVPCSHVGLVKVRRGLLLEWPVLCLRDGSLVELAAPTRFWFLPDPEFDRGLDALCAYVRGHAVAVPRHQWSVPRLAAGPLLIAVAVALVLIDPPWASDAWPLRQHARRLPDACRMFDAQARVLLPGAVVDRMLSRSDDDPHVARHTCLWNSTRLAADGTTLVDIGRLSVAIELEHGIGRISDAEEAHRDFQRETRIEAGEYETRISHLGDEAELIDMNPDADLAWVAVAAHRANIEEKIDLMYRDRSREREAAKAAERLARLGLSEIHFHRT